MTHSGNQLLGSLSAQVASIPQPHLKLTELKFGDVLANAGQPVTRVYFPHSGIISLVVELSSGAMIETAMVGRDGALNAASAFGGRVSLNKVIVQLGGTASVIYAGQLSRIA